MTDLPEVIWAFEDFPDSGAVPRSGIWIDEESECPEGSPGYILVSALSDPIRVHANMLRGTIAKPSIGQIVHLYGVHAIRKALAPVILREAEARVMERIADSLWTQKDEDDWAYWRGDEVDAAKRSARREMQDAIRSEAAALRAESALTDMARLGQEWERGGNVGTHENHVGTHEK